MSSVLKRHTEVWGGRFLVPRDTQELFFMGKLPGRVSVPRRGDRKAQVRKAGGGTCPP